MAILSCHVSIKLPPKISDGQPNSAVKHPAYIPTAEAGCFTAEFGKALESLCDSMLPSHPPLGLDFGAIGFQSKQSPDQNVTSLDRTQQQAVTCRL